MSRMKNKNLQHIKNIFEEKTGAELEPVRPRFQVRKILVLTAVMLSCFVLAAFGYPLFTPLDDDELCLTGSYEGGGIVSVYVENKSDKPLEFQKQIRLMRWTTSEEVEGTGGNVRFENTKFPPHTSGVMTIDLSDAYDVEALENPENNPEWYYLLLTNHDFLFGHDWMCSVNFTDSPPKETEASEPIEKVPAENVDRVEEALRFYFEKSYEGAPIGLNDANYLYQQKVDEAIKRFQGNVIPALSPTFMVGEPSIYLDPEPMLNKIPSGVIFDEAVPAEQQYLLSLDGWTYSDAYGRMVASAKEKAWVQDVTIPQRKGQTDGGASLPLIFLFVYDAQAASNPENSVFLYGRFLSFGEMEQYKVLEDAHYAIYDATDLIYTDVDAYLDYFLTTRQDVSCDDQIRQRVHNVYAYYRDRENIQALYGYRDFPAVTE